MTTTSTTSTSSVVSHQWATRPADERFTSVTALAAQRRYLKAHSKAIVVPNRKLTVLPSTTDAFDIAISGPNGVPAQFTHWSFSQLASLAGAPAGYLRDNLPGALVADNLNWGLHHRRSVEDIGVLLRKTNGAGAPGAGATGTLEAPETPLQATFAAATGPNYGRVWDYEICDQLVADYGDGVTGDWRVPGEFGKALSEVTKANTTIYGSDRDMWIFLANESNRVEIPNRRDGQSTTFARGFYITNSEVGGGVLGLGMFLFDYLCCNRIMWGVQERQEIRIRHTAGAPLRWDEEVRPVLAQFARTDTSPKTITETIKAAQATKLKTDVETFLASRFGKSSVMPIIAAHTKEELRPIETIFDAVTGATAYAKLLPYQDTRVAIEREAGKLLTSFAPQRSLLEAV